MPNPGKCGVMNPNSGRFCLRGGGDVSLDGGMGELCLAGAGVAEVYLGRPEETAARCVEAAPYGHRLRLCRTSDMVHRGADGAPRFIGRTDAQVNLNGVRIELGEVERVA